MESNTLVAAAHAADGDTLLEGVLLKWTNYVLGWQKRYFIVRQNCLLYCKSEADAQLGCRGAVNLSNAIVVPHDYDECRFDVRMRDHIWYVRAETSEVRQRWIDCLTKFAPTGPWKAVTYADNVKQIFALGSAVFLALDEVLDWLNEIEKLADAVESSENLKKLADDFKTGSVKVKTSLKSVAGNVEDMIRLSDSAWANIPESGQPVVPREVQQTRILSPTAEESVHCMLSDEEFFDAVESSLEKLEEEAQLRRRLERSTAAVSSVGQSLSKHPLGETIRRTTEEQMKSAAEDRDNENGWTLMMVQNNVTLYSKETLVDGVAVDPLKACCTVEGITGREVCHYFFHPEYRKDWESALERMTVVERIEDSVIIFHQVYKKVWPTAQRDTLFWSHITYSDPPDSPRVWSVVNHSTEHPQFPAGAEYVRLTFTVCLLCVTNIKNRSRDSLKREDVSCQITYSSTVNPGGWVPASAVRALRRIEYPKFLAKFTAFVIEQTRDKEILI